MNLDELRSVQSKERQKDSLQNLRPSFYQEVGEYIADLEAERDRVADQADDPFSSPEVGRLTDEIETAKDVVEAIYERRMGKLVKQSSLAAAGMPADDDGLTAEEADLFDDLVERISSNKSRVLDVLEGVDTEAAGGADADIGAATESDTDTGVASGPEPGAGSPASVGDSGATDDSDSLPGRGADEESPPVPPQEPSADADPTTLADDGSDAGPEPGSESGGSSGVSPADVMGGEGPEIDDTDAPSETATPTPPDDDAPDTASTESARNAGASDAADVDRVTVKITRDIGSILGVDDREYSLSTDDIVTLPEQNAEPLLEQEAAEPLE